MIRAYCFSAYMFCLCLYRQQPNTVDLNFLPGGAKYPKLSDNFPLKFLPATSRYATINKIKYPFLRNRTRFELRTLGLWYNRVILVAQKCT
jgi:hypothetical protein